MSRINGLDGLQRHLKEIAAAAERLDGLEVPLSFDPSDPASVEEAVAKMESAIDERISNLAHNDTVAGLASETKSRFAVGIREKARIALENSNEHGGA